MLENLVGPDNSVLTAKIDLVVKRIRGAYASGGRELGVDGTIPDSEVNRALNLIRWDYLTGFPALKAFQTPDRKKASEDGDAWFDQIASRKLSGTGSAQIVSGNTRRATRAQLSGL